jgi:hypothetical protein
MDGWSPHRGWCATPIGADSISLVPPEQTIILDARARQSRREPWKVRRVAFSLVRAMVRGMSIDVQTCTPEHPADATVVTRAMDIAGARHEVLPPRMARVGAVVLLRSTFRAPPG